MTPLTPTDACLNAVSWKQASSQSRCRQILIGLGEQPVNVANSFRLLTCPDRTFLRYWALPLRTVRNYNSSDSLEICEE